MRAKYFCLQFSVDILPVDLNIFADPDPGRTNFADPTDPDPKHCLVNTDISRTEDRKEIARHVSKVHGIEVDEEVG